MNLFSYILDPKLAFYFRILVPLTPLTMCGCINQALYCPHFLKELQNPPELVRHRSLQDQQCCFPTVSPQFPHSSPYCCAVPPHSFPTVPPNAVQFPPTVSQLFAHAHQARQEEDRECHRRGVRPQEAGAHPVRLRRMIKSRNSTTVPKLVLKPI